MQFRKHTKKLSVCLVFIILLSLLSMFASATTLHGTVYDLELNEVPNALVEISTQPSQRYLAKEGTYSFEVPKGNFTLKVTYTLDDINYTYEEDLIVSEQGSYVFDIFIFPELSEEEELLEDTDLELDIVNGGGEEQTNIGLWIALVFLVLITAFFLIKELFKRKKDQEAIEEEVESDYEKLIIKILKNSDGRTTQKELRKEIPLSEAKISLVVSELEHKGKIKKIKKGRGNIIVLNR